MAKPLVESLENRTHLSATLNRKDVSTILAQAASQTVGGGLSEEVIAVVDREANVLGVFARDGVDLTSTRGATIMALAIARARTAAEFESSQDAFTTRTARFIIQDHFPEPVNGTEGGPLYGVQFSNLIGNDVTANNPAIVGDPGGIPLYIKGQPVGGVGAAGDGRDTLARKDLDLFGKFYKAPNPKEPVYNGNEEYDADEAIAQAGAAGYTPSKKIQADNIFIAGLRLPYVAEAPASGSKNRSLASLVNGGLGTTGRIRSTPAVPYPEATFAGVSGQLKRPTSTDNAQHAVVPADQDPKHNYGIEGSGDSDTAHSLTSRDVRQVITDAIATAKHTRAGIRVPLDEDARVHVAVVDTAGNILGVFAESGATNFSYDVAVQKARTANFFSDDTHAFTSRAIGFLSQGDFPPGIDGDQSGPLYHVQNELSAAGGRDNPFGKVTLRQTADPADNPLRDGITIFPGGVPLYKNGVLVGAVGVSGDGVDQDDMIAYGGTAHYQPDPDIRSDRLKTAEVRRFIGRKAIDLFTLFGSKASNSAYPELSPDVTIENVMSELDNLDFRLPFVKFPRNPNL